MALQALPDDVLFGILRRVFSGPIEYRTDFKEQLYLLGIFQRLRAIALPKIYSYMYFSISINSNSSNPRYPNKHSNTFAEYISTNSDIIALANCTHMVKTANIKVEGLSANQAEFHDIIETLKSYSATWPSITNLELDIEHGMGWDDLSESQCEQLCCLSKIQCQALVSTFPSVTGLKLKSESTSSDIKKLFNQIYYAYANQLVKYTYWCDFDNADGLKLEVLQYLNIFTNSYVDILPRVNSRTLVDIHIIGVFERKLWAPFMDNKDDAVIEFPCLKKLWIEFIDYEEKEDTDVYMPGFLLNFPMLRSLSISSDKMFSFFKMARLPNKMEYIYLNVPPAMLAQFEKAGMPTAKQVTLDSL